MGSILGPLLTGLTRDATGLAAGEQQRRQLGQQEFYKMLQAQLLQNQATEAQSRARYYDAQATRGTRENANLTKDAEHYRAQYPELQGISDDGTVVKLGTERDQERYRTSLPQKPVQETPAQQRSQEVQSATGDAEGLAARNPYGNSPLMGPKVDPQSTAQLIHDYVRRKHPSLDDGTAWGIAAQVIARHTPHPVNIPGLALPNQAPGSDALPEPVGP